MRRLRSITFRDVIDILLPVCLLLTMYLAYVAVSTQGALEREVKRNQVRSMVAEQNSQEVLATLCLFRTNLELDLADNEQSLKTARDFLREHPNGTADFSRALLESSIERQEATIERQEQTINDYSGLDC